MKKLHRVLLVDDDEITNFFHRYLIESLQVADEIIDVPHGEAAIEFLKNVDANDPEQRVDLVFLDLNMPIMNGFEFLQALGEEPRLKECFAGPILMLTTSLHPKDMTKAQEFSELAGFYNKPMNENMVKEVISTYF